MLYQIVGTNLPGPGAEGGEVHLGCIEFDKSEPMRSTDASFYAFLVQPEDPRTGDTYCRLRGDFIVVSGVKGDATTEPFRDVLFFYRDPVKKGGASKWKFLVPKYNGRSFTGTVVLGGDALNGLYNVLSAGNLD